MRSPSIGIEVTAYVTWCSPANNPCNVCKAQYDIDGGCSDTEDQADLCDNLWYAIGAPPQSIVLEIDIGACVEVSVDKLPLTNEYYDTPPDDKFTCEEQKEFGKCSEPWMVGH